MGDVMTGYHVTTMKKLQKYKVTGGILPGYGS